MTTITFFKENGVFYGFQENGHTGFGEEGDDILCAGLSAMTMLIINAIEISYASDADYRIDENTADVRLTAKSALPRFESDIRKQYAVSGLIQAYFFQLNDLTEDYYQYLTVEEKEIPFEKLPPI